MIRSVSVACVVILYTLLGCGGSCPIKLGEEQRRVFRSVDKVAVVIENEPNCCFKNYAAIVRSLLSKHGIEVLESPMGQRTHDALLHIKINRKPLGASYHRVGYLVTGMKLSLRLSLRVSEEQVFCRQLSHTSKPPSALFYRASAGLPKFRPCSLDERLVGFFTMTILELIHQIHGINAVVSYLTDSKLDFEDIWVVNEIIEHLSQKSRLKVSASREISSHAIPDGMIIYLKGSTVPPPNLEPLIIWGTANYLSYTEDGLAVPALIGALGDGNEYLRRLAATILGVIGDNRAVEHLIAALSDEDSGVRSCALTALQKITGVPYDRENWQIWWQNLKQSR